MPQISNVLTLEQQEIYDELSRFRIPINDRVAIWITVDKSLKDKAQTHVRQLISYRKITLPQNITRRSADAIRLAKHMQSRSRGSGKLPRHIQSNNIEPKKYEALLDDAVEILQNESLLFLEVAQDEALIATLISEGELEVITDSGEEIRIPRGFFEIEKIQGYDIFKPYHLIDYVDLPEDYYDRTAINEAREADGLPPLPAHNAILSTEQMLAQIDAVKQANQPFSEVVSSLFTNYMDHMVIAILGKSDALQEDVETDESGFHTGELGNDLDGNVQRSDKKKRR